MTTDQTPAPESARALLWRHGVPEDVIDGVLCLHAQELAAVIRSNPGAIPYRPQLDEDGGFWWDLRDRDAAADLIDPTRTAPAVSSVPPPADRAATELAKHVTRVIFALKSPAPPGSTHYQSGWDDGLEAAMDAARDAVLAVLPEPTNQAASELASLAVNAGRALQDEKRHYEIACQENARLRAVVARLGQMADAWEQRLPEVIRTPAVVSAIRAALESAEGPRRMAAEEQPAETQASGCDRCGHGHGAHNISGCAECPGGWRADHRFVSPTTERPAVGEQPETQEASLRCVCGAPVQPAGADWEHQPGTGDRCMYRPAARPRCPDCQLPHVLTPGSLPMTACQAIRDRITAEDATP